MERVRAGRRALKLFFAVVVAVYSAAGCGVLEDVIKIPTPLVFTSLAPRPSSTPSPTGTPEPSNTPVPTRVTPVQAGTPGVNPAAAILPANAARLEKIVDAGKGIPYQITFSLDGELVGAATSNDIYLFDALTLETRLGIRTGLVQQRLAFSPDGSRLAAGDRHGKVTLWNTTGELLQELVIGSDLNQSLPGDGTNTIGRAQPVLALAFSPDGLWLAASSWDRRVYLWRVEDGELLQSIAVRGGAVREVAFSPDNELVYGWAPQETIQVWSRDNGSAHNEIYLGTDPQGLRPAGIAFAQEGALAVAYFGRSMRAFETETGRTLYALDSLPAAPQALALSADGSTLAAQVLDGQFRPGIEIRAAENAQVGALILPPATNGRLLMALSPAGDALVTLGDRLTRWDTSAGADPLEQAAVIGLQEFRTSISAYSSVPRDGLVLQAGLDGSLAVYDLSAGRFDALNTENRAEGAALVPAGAYTSWAVSPDLALAYGDALGGVSVRAEPTGPLTALQGHSGPVRSLAFSASGGLLASSAEDGLVRVHDLAGSGAGILLDVGVPAFNLAFGAADRHIILQTAAEVQVWSLDEGVLLERWAAQRLIVSADGTLAAAAVQNREGGSVSVYQLPDGDVVQSFPLEGYRLALSPDGSLLAMAGMGLTLWSIADGSLLYRSPSACCGTLRFSPDGLWLALILWDGSLQVWAIP